MTSMSVFLSFCPSFYRFATALLGQRHVLLAANAIFGAGFRVECRGAVTDEPEGFHRTITIIPEWRNRLQHHCGLTGLPLSFRFLFQHLPSSKNSQVPQRKAISGGFEAKPTGMDLVRSDFIGHYGNPAGPDDRAELGVWPFRSMPDHTKAAARIKTNVNVTMTLISADCDSNRPCRPELVAIAQITELIDASAVRMV